MAWFSFKFCLLLTTLALASGLVVNENQQQLEANEAVSGSGPFLTREVFAQAAGKIGKDPPPNDDWRLSDADLPAVNPKQTKNNLARPADTWPGGVVPYRIASGTFSAAQLVIIAAGILDITSNTCITFVEDTDMTATDYIHIQDIRDGCNMDGGGFNQGKGEHVLNLQRTYPGSSSTCVHPVVVAHELLHGLGVMHEHKRPDRDDFITIHWTNIKTGPVHNYWLDEWFDSGVDLTKCTNSGSDGTLYNNCVSGLKTTAFGQAYDFASIMHYGRTSSSFTIDNAQPAITLNSDPTREFGGNQMSAGDIAKIKSAYSCTGNTGTSCFKHVSIESGYLSSTDIAKGCTVLISSPHGLAKIKTKSWMFTGDCATNYIDIYMGNEITDKAKLGPFCATNIPGAITLGNEGILIIEADPSVVSWELEFTTDQTPDTPPSAFCCPGPLMVNIAGRSSFDNGAYTLISTTTDNSFKDSRIYPVYKHPTSTRHLYRIPDPSLTQSYPNPWIIGNTVGANSGGVFFTPSPNCPEYLVETSAGDFSIECQTTCSGDPYPAYASTSRTWANGVFFNNYAQYTCSDGTFQYAVCEASGWVYHNMGKATNCYDDGSPEPPVDPEPPISSATTVYCTTGSKDFILNPDQTTFFQNEGKVYKNNENCKVRFIAPLGYQVRLILIRFNLKSSKNCNKAKDYLLARPLYGNYRKIKMCARKGKTVTSELNRLSLHFKTNNRKNKPGFRFRVLAVPTAGIM